MGLFTGLFMAGSAIVLPAFASSIDLVWATNAHPTRSAAVVAFERANPDVRIRILPVATPWKLQLQCRFGRCPDILTFFQTHAFQDFARDDLLLPLPQETPWPHFTTLQAYAFRSRDGALMAIPQVAYPYVLFYNPDLVPQARAEAVRTWDDLLRAAAMSSHRGDDGRMVFGLEPHSDLLWLQTLVWQCGADLRGSPEILPCIQSALAEMRRWREIPGIIPEPKDRFNVPSTGASQGVLGSLFLQGRAAFYWSGSWKIWDLSRQSRVPWRVRGVPGGKRGNTTLLGGNAFGVYRGTQHPDEATRFVEFLGSHAVETVHVASGIVFPSRKDVAVPEIARPVLDTIADGRTADYAPGVDAVAAEIRIRETLDAHRLGHFGDADAARAILSALRGEAAR